MKFFYLLVVKKNPSTGRWIFFINFGRWIKTGVLGSTPLDMNRILDTLNSAGEPQIWNGGYLLTFRKLLWQASIFHVFVHFFLMKLSKYTKYTNFLCVFFLLSDISLVKSALKSLASLKWVKANSGWSGRDLTTQFQKETWSWLQFSNGNYVTQSSWLNGKLINYTDLSKWSLCLQ